MISWLQHLEIVECLELDWTWMHVLGCNKDLNPKQLLLCVDSPMKSLKQIDDRGVEGPCLWFWTCLVRWVVASTSPNLWKFRCLVACCKVASSVYHFQLTGCKSGLTGGIAAQQSVYATTLLLSEIAPVFLCFDMMWVSSVLKLCCMLLPFHFRDSHCVNTSLLIIILLVAAADASL